MKLADLTLILVLLTAPIIAPAHPGSDSRIARLNQLIEENPKQQALFIARGAAYSHERAWQLAEQDFTHAQQLGSPTEVDYELGLMNYLRGAYPESRAALERYLHRYPEHKQALLYSARAAQKMGVPGLALKGFLAYLDTADNPHPGDVVAIAKLLADGTDIGFKASLTLLDRQMMVMGVQPQLQRFAIALELQREQIDLAIERCQQLEESLGASPQWKFEMAQLLLFDQRSAEALLLLDSASHSLAQLRPTPARLSLAQRIETLQIEAVLVSDQALPIQK